MNMNRLSKLYRHMWDRVDLENALKECTEMPEMVSFISSQIKSMDKEIDALMNFIYSLEPSPERFALLAHCLWGMCWRDIAVMDGCQQTLGSYRMAAYRGIRRIVDKCCSAKTAHSGALESMPDSGGRHNDE